VIIPDLPGWGASSRQAGADYGVDAQAARLDAFVHALNLPRVMLVGHDMGGAIAGMYAAGHPDRVAGLVLMDSFGLQADAGALADAAGSAGNPFAYDDRAGYRHLAGLLFATPPTLPGRFVDVLVDRNVANRAFRQRVFADLRGHGDILDAQLGKLTMPVLGMWCHDDKITGIAGLDALRGGLAHASDIGASTLNGCGHVPELEKPDITAKLIAGFTIAH
jgi:pimeloyl-ACP methyl ester carboxylesterase